MKKTFSPPITKLERDFGFGYSLGKKMYLFDEIRKILAENDEAVFATGIELGKMIARNHPELKNRIWVGERVCGFRRILPPVMIPQAGGRRVAVRRGKKVCICQYCRNEFRWGETEKGAVIPYDSVGNGEYVNHRANCPGY